MSRHWLILADDLTGAADSGIAFAKRGHRARVTWGEPGDPLPGQISVLSVDTESRGENFLDAAGRLESERAAAAVNGATLRELLDVRIRVFKKVDSTMRGHPGVEIEVILREFAARRGSALGIFAPAFPAAGRVTRGGHVYVNGEILEDSRYSPRGYGRNGGRPAALFSEAGVRNEPVPLAKVRASVEELRAAFAAIENRGAYQGVIAICDAETDDDLDRIVAAAGIDEARRFFIGSAGLTHAIARRDDRGQAAIRQPTAPSELGALVVVGSLATPSLSAAAELGRMPGMKCVRIDRWTLHPDQPPDSHATLLGEISESLALGIDVAIGIDWGSGDYQEHGIWPWVVRGLVRVLEPLAGCMSGLIATGGETAFALLSRFGATAIDLVDEIEPGMSLGHSVGAFSVPVVTKSGSFGNHESLKKAVERLRQIRQSGWVA
jgi:uncharacterized protein YgbK (DUF1537 family)